MLVNIYMGGLCAAIVYWFIGVYCMTHDPDIWDAALGIVADYDMWIIELTVWLMMVIGLLIIALWPIVLLFNVVLIVDYLLRN